MERTLHQLRLALAANEPLTDAERERLKRQREELTLNFVRLWDRYREPWGEWPEPGAEFEALRAGILRDLNEKDVTELRELVRVLLTWVEWGDAFVAQAAGADRRQRRERRMGGQKSALTRRETTASILEAVRAIRARNPTLTDAAAVRVYLQSMHPTTFHTWTADEVQAKVTNLTRRLRSHRKKVGDELS